MSKVAIVKHNHVYIILQIVVNKILLYCFHTTSWVAC